MEDEKILIEFIGARKGVGSVKGARRSGYQYPVGEFDKDIGEHLVKVRPDLFSFAKFKESKQPGRPKKN